MTIESSVREHLGRLLTDYLDHGGPVDPVAAPVAIQSGSAVVYVRLVDAEPPVVRVFSPLLRRVAVTPELLTELNAINGRLSFVRLFWREDTVIAATELLAASLDPEELTHACDMLCDTADYYDGRLHERFGGEIAFDQRM